MNISDVLTIANVLIEELEKLIEASRLDDEELFFIMKKTNAVKLKMMMCYRRWDGPVELFDQIERIDSVIKKLEQMQNKHVT